MLKLASLALVPMLAAAFFPHDDAKKTSSPTPTAPVNTAFAEPVPVVHAQDQAFLNTLEQQEKVLVQRIAAQQADQEFLLKEQEEALIPVKRAIAVDRSIPNDPWADAIREGHQVRRAIPVEQPTVITQTVESSSAPAISSDLRNTFQQSFATSGGQEPEVRRAIPVSRPRLAISIYGE